MANCSNCNGCSGSGRNCTRVGALGTLSRACGYSRYPYYTGPCPPAPCTNRCGACAAQDCHHCGCSDAGVTCEHSCGCANCHGCDHSCGCSVCDSCNACDDGCDDSWRCSCGCSNGISALNCGRCGRLRGGRKPASRAHGVFSAAGPVRLSEGGSVNFEAIHMDSDAFATDCGDILIRRPGLYYAAITADIPGHNEVDTVLRLELDGQSAALCGIPVSARDDETTSNYAGHAVFHAKAGARLRLCSLRGMDVHCASSQTVFTLTIFRIS